MTNIKQRHKVSRLSFFNNRFLVKCNFTFIILFFSTLFSVAAETEYIAGLTDENRVLAKPIELHLMSIDNPLTNSTVNLKHEGAWLFFDNIKPSGVIANYSSAIFINDVVLNPGVNARVAIYASGTVVMPHGPGYQPLTVYTGSGFSGDSSSLSVYTYYNSLSVFDNSISSFKLKRGYMATFANNADGTGYSRVYIADEGDVDISGLPEELNEKISFIRVFRHQWVTKKGWCGSGSGADNDADKTASTWFYSWSADQASTNNLEYAVIKQNYSWPGWTEINGKQNVSHLLGYNEPDRSDQANLDVDVAIAQWPNMMHSGLRIGSPATSDPFNGWLFEFVDKCDELNYRIDFVAIHAYWTKTPQQWYNDLKYVHERTGRPIWITEWNNGANWTSEPWPDDTGDLTSDNAQKQLNDITAILQVLDTAHFVERYSIYNWVQDKRAMILADTLTPAGEYYASNKSVIAFDKVNNFIPFWNALQPVLEVEGFHASGGVGLIWSDPNGELTKNIAIERKIDDGQFKGIKILSGGSSTSYKDTVDEDMAGSISYRINAEALNKTNAYSNEAFCYRTTGGPILQVADFTLSGFEWQNAVLTAGYSGPPIVILGPLTYNNRSVQMTSRVKSVTPGTLNFHIEPWQYIEDPLLEEYENVSLLSVPAGHFEYGRLILESGDISGVADEWKEVTFSEPFQTVPVVFTTQITNNPSFPTTSRIRNVSTSGFEVCLQKEEAVDGSLWGDKVGYLAITPGTGMIDNKKIIVGSIDQVGDYYYSGEIEVDDSYIDLAVFAGMQTVNDDITSTLRYSITDDGNIRVFKKREKSLGSSPVAKDQVAYMIVDIKSSQHVPTIGQGLNNPRVYPNPVKDILYVNFDVQKHIEIYDLSGVKCIDTKVQSKVDIEKLLPGMYFICIDGTEQYKIVKL